VFRPICDRLLKRGVQKTNLIAFVGLALGGECGEVVGVGSVAGDAPESGPLHAASVASALAGVAMKRVQEINNLLGRARG
jgi:hypothetical protein